MEGKESLWDEGRTAAYFNASKALLRKWRREGKGPNYVKVGRLVRYDPTTVISWLKQHEVKL